MFSRIHQWYIHRTIKYYNERYFNLLRRFNSTQTYEDVVIEPFTYGFITYNNRPKITPTFIYESIHDFLFTYIDKYIKNNILKCYFFVYYLKSVTSIEDMATLFEKAVQTQWFHAMMFIKIKEDYPWWLRYVCSQKVKPMTYEDWRTLYSYLAKGRRNDTWLKERLTQSVMSCPLNFSHKEYKILLHDISQLPKEFQIGIMGSLLQRHVLADIFQQQLTLKDEQIWKTWDILPLSTKHAVFYNNTMLQDVSEFYYFKDILLENNNHEFSSQELEIFI